MRNQPAIRNKLDPSMIGYQRFLDGVVRDTTALKQIRIHLLDTQTLTGPDVAVIQTNWEKRFIAVSNFQPGMFTGHSTFLFHRGKHGWRIAAFGGDNLFASQSGVLGQVTFTPAVIPLTSISPALGLVNIPVQIEVLDRYIDNNPGNNRPPSVLTRMIRVQ